MGTPVVELSGISKRFGATQALYQVDLALWPSEIHALAGENGAGKSTLIRILSGVVSPDVGTLQLAGQPRRFRGAAQAMAAAIATIHQELSLVGAMSVADNLHLGLGGQPLAVLRPKRRRQQALSWLARVDLDIDPDLRVEQLSLADRQRVEIARALRQTPRLLILDEPTSALSQREADQLLTLLERLRDEGCALLYVSHRSAELRRLASRITVLRDGRVVHRHDDGTPLSDQQLSLLMAGPTQRRAQATGSPATTAKPTRRDTPALQASDFRLPAAHTLTPPSERSFTLAPGAIVGLAGLHGCGARAWLYALMGMGPATVERIQLAGDDLRPSPQTCVEAGMLLLSGDRQLSVLTAMTIIDNTALSSLPRWSPYQWIRQRALAARVTALSKQAQLKTETLTTPCGALSGGNQQKVALMRSMMCRPNVLLLDDATRGIDVRAKAQLHEQLRELAQTGSAIVMVSSDTTELVQLCDRVLVLVAGSIVQRLSGPALSRQAVVACATAARGTA